MAPVPPADRRLQLYHRLPARARTAVVAAHGMRLHWWRHGRGSEALVEAALERDRWSSDRWDEWQRDRLAGVLRHAATTVPHYRGQDPGAALSEWPVLEKETVRAAPRSFVSAQAPRRLYEDHTSGSTNTPLAVWSGRSTLTEWFALYEARTWRWHGTNRRQRWAILGEQLVVDRNATTPPYWVWNAGLRQLYLSLFHLDERSIASYATALRTHRVQRLLTYPSAGAELARLAFEQGVALPPLDLVVTNAEPLLPGQRELLGTAFGCPVREGYGVAEMVVAASECEAGALHLWPEAGVTEVLDDGSLVCTGLLNPAMPLVRYRVGDRGRLDPDPGPCPCGRWLPRLAALDGRTDDVIVTPDGRRVGRLDAVFKADLPVREAQIVQDAPDHITVRVVPAPGFDDAVARTLVDLVRQRLGPMEVTIAQIERVPRDRTGKLRAVVSHLDRTRDGTATARPGPPPRS